MLFDNPVFLGWYTDKVNIYRVEDKKVGNVAKKQRVLKSEGIPCRIYSAKKDGPSMQDTAARSVSTEKMACDLSIDIKAGDELQIIRGGGLGRTGTAERFFSGSPQQYYDPVGGALSGLEHQEVGLLRENLID